MAPVRRLDTGTQLTLSPYFVKYWRLGGLILLLMLALSGNIFLADIAPAADSPAYVTFVIFWFITFIPYIAASMLVLTTPAQTGRGLWLELGIILGGAALLRAILLPIPPNLSHDSWRYLWDARVTLLGYSPYVTTPNDPVFNHLHDFLYQSSRFRNVPTIYPPAAQAVYILSYLAAPGNLLVLKSIFAVCDLITCGALAYLLKKKQLDPARCLIYAWCPLPIIEFAVQGHLDVLPIMFTILTVICTQSNWRGSRALTGLFLALATLTKIYPLLFIVALWRRRDWSMLLTCLSVIVLAYLPYIILGNGQVLGFFSSYASEYTPNAGIVEHTGWWIGRHLGWNRQLITWSVYLADLLIICGASLVLFSWRQRGRMSVEAAVLVLTGIVFIVSSHIFPWYTAALLPWIAVLAGPVKTKQGWSGKGIGIAFAWYFTCTSILSYFFDHVRDWSLYYLLVYVVVIVGLCGAVLASNVQIRVDGKKLVYLRSGNKDARIPTKFENR